MLLYQSAEGAWPKNHDLLKPPSSAEELAKIQKEKGNTIDNGSTTAPIRFLALITEAGGGESYQKAVIKGIDYLLDSQYENGGFPQFYPLRPSGYYSHITYNDNAMISALELLRDVASGRPPFTFVDDLHREKAAQANEKGIRCILKTQIRENGKLTVWCAQHHEATLEPAWARKYEPPSLSGSESVGVVRFLMEIEKPTPEIIASIEAAIRWLQAAAIKGVRLETFKNAEGKQDRRVVGDATASPLWARFYELKTHRPLFLGRDSVFHYSIGEIEFERRNGYAYYGTWPASLLEDDYPKWQSKQGFK
ncbi:pectate lyase [Prosthecobacter dejongeii]|uniref:PelA/Pel-15E family pectate lyase n=1 Tax=Prosthecobacter dejongeii TaxID=48465 RepID=A0A7W7YQ29_9BACT|nr:PelA/Pel-15E family pectate lyase [Prosthecobacter dejongeii]